MAASAAASMVSILDILSGPCSPIVDVRQSGVMPPRGRLEKRTRGPKKAADLVEHGGRCGPRRGYRCQWPPVTVRVALTMVMPSLPFLKRLRGGAAVPRRSDGVGRSGLPSRPAHHPSGTGARRALNLMCPELPVDGMRTP